MRKLLIIVFIFFHSVCSLFAQPYSFSKDYHSHYSYYPNRNAATYVKAKVKYYAEWWQPGEDTTVREKVEEHFLNTHGKGINISYYAHGRLCGETECRYDTISGSFIAIIEKHIEGDKLLVRNQESFTYDSLGRILIHNNTSKNKILSISEHLYIDNLNMIVAKYQPELIQEEFIDTMVFDQNNYLISSKAYDHNKKYDLANEYSGDSVVSLQLIDGRKLINNTMQFDKNGIVLRQINYSKEGEVVSFMYSEIDSLTGNRKEIHVSGSGKIVGFKVFDKNGNMLDESYYNDKSEIEMHCHNTFDPNNLILESFTDGTTISGGGKTVYTYEYYK